MSRRHHDPDFRSGPGGDVGWLIRLRRREVTLFDSAAGGTQRPRSARAAEPPRRSRRSLIAATLAPAVVAAIGGALLAPTFGSDERSGFGPDTAAARDLAREAARPLAESHLTPLVPVVERGGRPQLAANGAPPVAEDARPAAPAWISIPRAGVESPVDSVGATQTGLTLPALGRSGWWDGGPRPGEDGRAVIVGHLDSKKGPDVFARVPELATGDSIVVRDHAGESHRYAVVGITRVRKAEFPTQDVYGPAPRPVLVLVTCGGPYDAAIGHYRDNVLVYARAV
jgi:sortase (surface protein transpeptidase)